MIEVAFFSLCLGLVFAVFSFISGFAAWVRPSIGLVAIGRHAILAVFLCVFLAVVVFWNAIIFHDFSVRYVYEHSAIDMPPFYLLTSFWSALEGSHLLWMLTLSTVAALSVMTVSRKNASLRPGLHVAFGGMLTFMLLVALLWSPPFDRLFPPANFGRGMNALLQNPYMAVHPPMLFIGYSLLAVPFAYSLAALLHGGFTSQWISAVRRWLLLAWCFLTVAIFLGGKWAYVVLGWSGYWAWDPVENSSFLPWLAATAGLHTLLISSKTGRLPRLLLFLCMCAFILTFQGTFITRSGVVSSVHSFAESDIGPAYLAWILILLTTTLTLLFTKGNRFAGAGKTNQWNTSRETALLFTHFFLLFLLVLVFIGTLLPIVMEALTGTRISIQQPFYNAFAPWIGMGLVLLLGVGHLLHWKGKSVNDPVSGLFFPVIWSGLLTSCIAFTHHFDVRSTVTFFFILWSAGCLIMGLVFKFHSLRWNLTLLLKHNRLTLGAFLVHIGFLIAMAGFAGNFQNLSAQTTLALHESVNFQGYSLTNEGLEYQQEFNKQSVGARIKVVDQSHGRGSLVIPLRNRFTNSEQLFSEVGIQSNFWHDLYIVLVGFDVGTQTVNLKMNWNPLVKLVWTSIVIMTLGSLISLSHRFRSSSEEDEEDIFKSSSRHANTVKASVFLASILAVSIFGFASVIFTDSQTAIAATVIAPDKRLEEIGHLLRCPTCQGMSILESDTPQSRAMRTEIQEQIAAGKSQEDILLYFKERYGPWILREPDASSVAGLVIWLLPAAGLIVGPGLLWMALRKSRKHLSSSAPQGYSSFDQQDFVDEEDISREIKEYIAEAKEKLEKERGSLS